MAPEWILPAAAAPMLASIGSPADLRSKDCAFELKWDGMRVIIAIRDGEWRMVTRNRLDARSRFPELEHLKKASPAPPAIFDGEIVCLDEHGKPDFARLQQRIQAAGDSTIRNLADRFPARLVLFDILCEGEEWLLDRRWDERRQRLEQVVKPSGPIEVSPLWDNGEELWNAVCRLDLEGVMVKRRDARYLPGQRSTSWRKVKRAHTVEVVIGGWTEGAGQRGESIGALMVGLPTPAGLSYMGHVGAGLDQTALAAARQRLNPIEVSVPPFVTPPRPNAPPHWVLPQIVCEVRHHGQTAAGSLRAPVFVRWRPDRSPADL